MMEQLPNLVQHLKPLEQVEIVPSREEPRALITIRMVQTVDYGEVVWTLTRLYNMKKSQAREVKDQLVCLHRQTITYPMFRLKEAILMDITRSELGPA